MPRDRLSDAKLRNAKAAAKSYKLYDGGGLFLLIHPNGSRYWRLKYRANGKEKLLPIRAITVPLLREALLLVEKRGALAALRKVRMWESLVFRYAIATGRAESDPTAPLRGTFKIQRSRNFSALTKQEEFGTLVKRVQSYDGSVITRCALLLAAYTFVRTGELRGAEWMYVNVVLTIQ